FDPGSPDLKPEGQVLIRRLAGAIPGEGVRPLEEGQLAGHPPDVPTGNAGYTNWELAADGATNVVRWLVYAGIDPDSVRLSA
ncbi:OmpA family protein, partial [Pseudomonas sp. CCC3.2]|uniref:OmpA/MotB family protein n=1 Tax=Pseudomonas sp. CCC3.2 TaxID=3048608 RepID=UPI002B2260EB